MKLYSILAAAALLVTSAAGQTGIFESHGDIGVTPKTGTIESTDNGYRITGGGDNIWANQDAFHFAWKRMSGDVRITADLHFVGPGAVAHRKVVLMVRQDLTPGAAYADAALDGDGLTSLQYRPTADGKTEEIKSTLTGPVRLRIERRGNQFTMSAGAPGSELTASAPATVSLTDPVYVGIGISSHDANVLGTAEPANVPIAQLPKPFRTTATIYAT